MATTHAKIWAALRRAAKRERWDSIDELVEAIGQSPGDEFKLDGEPLQPGSIRRTIQLMVSLEFLAEQDERAIRVTSTGRTALGSEEKFNLKAQSAVRSYLANCGVPIDRILRVISQIQLPDVPDAETIHSALYAGAGETPQTLSKEQLRSLLFFYAMAGGMTRCVRVFYGAAQ